MDPLLPCIQALNGLASASSLFITACGLTLVFGVTRIVNFAHGSLYMLGAYTAATLVPRLLELSFGPVTFWAGILASALIVGLIGVIDRGAAAAPDLPRARTVPAARHLRRRARGAGSRRSRCSGREDILGPAGARPARAGRNPRTALSRPMNSC